MTLRSNRPVCRVFPDKSQEFRQFEFTPLRHTVYRCCLQFGGSENFARKAGFIAPVAHRRRRAYAGFSRFGPDPLRMKQKRFASPQRAGFSPGHRRSPQARDFNWSAVKRVQWKSLSDTEDIALRRPFQRQVDAVEQGLDAELGGLLPVADRFHDGGCDEGQA
jgi:hypothetical protein